MVVIGVMKAVVGFRNVPVHGCLQDFFLGGGT